MFRVLLLLVLCVVGCQKAPPEPDALVGRDPTFYPLHLGNVTPSINAYLNEVVQACDLYIADVSATQLLEGLEKKHYQSILTVLPPDLENRERFFFSDEILALGPVLIVRQSSSATSLVDLDGDMIGYNQFSNDVLIVQRNESLLPKPYANMALALEDLEEGRVDGVLMQTLEAHALVKNQYRGILKIVTGPLDDQGIRLLVPKTGDSDIIEKFNECFRDLEKKGAVKRLKERFGLS